MYVRKNQTVCEWKGVEPQVPESDSIVGLAVETLKSNSIIHGLRHNPEETTNGWYIWSGNYQDSSDFFKPVCHEHLQNYLPPEILEYLNLPPGFRFLLDLPNYEDVWFDDSLLKP